jgi:predicted XRE-type DNA-binding protein
MRAEKLEVVRGSGNVFRDLGHENADAEQLKAILAAEIIKALDREHLTVRAAHSRTGIAAADFSRIRNADLGRFTLDRLFSILNRMGSRVEVKVRVRRSEENKKYRSEPLAAIHETMEALHDVGAIGKKTMRGSTMPA